MRTKRGLLRAAGLGLAGLVALAAMVAFALPLWFRGPRLVRLAERFLPPTSGTIQVRSAAVAPHAVFAFLLGRPVRVTLEDVAIDDPEGTPVLRARRLSAAVRVQRRPVEVQVDDLRIEDGLWRLGRMQRQPGIGFFAAFTRPLPPGAAAPAPAPRPRPGAGPAARRTRAPVLRLDLEAVRLERLDVHFDFPTWGLDLHGVSADGSLHVRPRPAPGQGPFAFEAREVRAPGGGRLRLGGDARPVVLPIDAATIAHVGTEGEADGTLALTVREARTGRSRLSGRLAFPDLFRPGAGRPPGMELAARWERAGDGLRALVASARVPGLEVDGPEADLTIRLGGPFVALTGAIDLSGVDVGYRGVRFKAVRLSAEAQARPPRVRVHTLEARGADGGTVRAEGVLEAGGPSRVAVALSDLRLTPYLPAYLVPLLGGTIDGTLAVVGRAAPASVRLEGLDLSLVRARRGPLPTRIRLRDRGAPTPSSAEEMNAVIERLELDRDSLVLGPVRASAFGAAIQLALRVRRGADTTVPSIDGRLGARGLDLGQALPGTAVTGRLSFEARVRGPADDVEATVDFPPAATLSVLGAAYELPGRIAVGVRGDSLLLHPLTVRGPGASQVVAHGSIVFDRRMDLVLGLRRHPLAALPGVAGLIPALEGHADAHLRLHGPVDRPTAVGQLALSNVVYAGQPLGGGGLRFRAGVGDETLFEGQVLDGLQVQGRFAAGGPRAWSAEARFRELPVHALWSTTPGLAVVRASATGMSRVEAVGGGPTALETRIDDLHVVYDVPPNRCARPPCTIELWNEAPVRLTATGFGRQARLAPTRLRSGASTLVLEGGLEAGRLQGLVTGRLDLGTFAPLHPPALALAGQLDARLAVDGAVESPRLTGAVTVAEPVRLRPAALALEAVVPSGAIRFEEGVLSTSDLPIEFDGSRLHLTAALPLDVAVGRSVPLEARLVGRLQARLLERLLPREFQRASGPIAVDVSLAGPVDGLRPGAASPPALRADLTLGRIELHPRRLRQSLRIQGGHVRLEDGVVSAQDVVVDVEPHGRVILGPGTTPARLRLGPGWPPRLGTIDVPLRGHEVFATAPGLRIDAANFALRLTGKPGARLRLGGDVVVDGARYQVRFRRARLRTLPLPSPAPTAPTAPVELDLRVRTGADPLVVDPPWLPDLRLDVDYHIGGTLNEPVLEGELGGRTFYSRLLVWLYELFH